MNDDKAQRYDEARARGMTHAQAVQFAEGGEGDSGGAVDPGRVTIERPGRFRSGLSTAVQGVTLGFGDEIGAAIRAAPRLVPGGKSFGDAYGENVEAAREGLAAAREDFPVQSPISEVVGAVAPAVLTAGMSTPASVAGGARAVPSLGRLAASGAALGATEAAGRAEGGVVDRLPAAAVGGVAGGVLGGALPLGTRVLGRAGASLGIRGRGAETRAADEILDALEEPLDAIRGRLTGTVDETLMDVSRGARGLGETAALYPGARGALEEALETRSRQQFPRVQEAIEGGTGLLRRSAGELADEIVERRAAQAAPLYEQAYAQGQVRVTPALEAVLKKPSVRRAFERAQAIAAEEGVDIGQIGFEEGSRSFVAPTVQALDYIKRGLDDVLYVGQRATDQGGLGPAQMHTIRQTRRQFMDAVEEVTGGPEGAYAQARRLFSGQTAMKDALEAGRARFHLDPPAEIARMLDDMTPAEVEMFRRGAVDNVLHRLGNVADRSDLMKRLVQSPNEVQRMALLFDDPATYQNFLGRMGAMAEQGVTRDAVLKGSQTARRMTGRESLEGEGLGSAFSVRRIADSLASGRRATVGEQTAEQLAPMLTRSDVPALLGELSTRERARRLRSAVGGSLSRLGSIQSGRAGGVVPDQRER